MTARVVDFLDAPPGWRPPANRPWVAVERWGGHARVHARLFVRSADSQELLQLGEQRGGDWTTLERARLEALEVARIARAPLPIPVTEEMDAFVA